MKKIQIYDMTLRDGLESIKQQSLEIIYKCINELFKNNYYYIEYGAITNNNNNSDKILEYININFPNTKIIYGILIPNIELLNYEIIKKNNAFSLLCTTDDNYSYNNFKKSAYNNFIDVLNMLHDILRLKLTYSIKKIRIYIACAFNNKNININLYDYTTIIINIISMYNLNSDIIDIVFADTYNNINEEILFDTLSMFTTEKKKYIGLHLHCGNKFINLINVCLKMKINKIDTGLCNIGDCNFIKYKQTPYISTINLLKYLNYNNFDLNLLEETENKLINILQI